jgi:hypothetical protein
MLTISQDQAAGISNHGTVPDQVKVIAPTSRIVDALDDSFVRHWTILMFQRQTVFCSGDVIVEGC